MSEPIQVFISPNERPDPKEKKESRATKLAKAIADDPRFLMPEFKEIDADVRFEGRQSGLSALFGDNGRKDAQNVELKEASDYVQSALGKDGHLFQQILTLRESGDPCLILVLGGDAEVSDAIKASLTTRYRGQELAFNISSYESRLIDFESQAEALGCPVRRWKSQPWKRLLSLAHKTLTGASLMGYIPRPAENERAATALCMARSVGEKTAFALMGEYGSIANLCTASLEDLASFKQDGRRIGPKKAEAVIRLLHGEIPGKHDPHLRARA